MRNELVEVSEDVVEIVSGNFTHIFNFNSEDVTVCEVEDNKKSEPEVHSFKNYKKECKTNKGRLNRAKDMFAA